MALNLNASTKLLFIGDSITDVGRREDAAEAVGTGYVRRVRDCSAPAIPPSRRSSSTRASAETRSPICKSAGSAT